MALSKIEEKAAIALGEAIGLGIKDCKALVKVESERIDNLWKAINTIEGQIDKVQEDHTSSILKHHKRIEELVENIERQDKCAADAKQLIIDLSDRLDFHYGFGSTLRERIEKLEQAPNDSPRWVRIFEQRMDRLEDRLGPNPPEGVNGQAEITREKIIGKCDHYKEISGDFTIITADQMGLERHSLMFSFCPLCGAKLT